MTKVPHILVDIHFLSSNCTETQIPPSHLVWIRMIQTASFFLGQKGLLLNSAHHTHRKNKKNRRLKKTHFNRQAVKSLIPC